MLTLKELDLLLSKPLRKAVKDNLASDPAKIALDKKIPYAQLVATQVKYLQKAQKKLPSFYRAQCVISPLAFEQCSSEASAAHRHYSGEFCIDFGGGLGVDTYYLSKRFDRVISVERDPVLTEIARANFEFLKRDNVSIVKSDIEEILALHPTLSADLVFLDPDRRGADGKKKVTLADCSPDVEKLLPRLRKLAPKVVIKLSPMFDVDEAFRCFGPNVIVDVVSVNGECKEVVVEIDKRIQYPIIKASGVGRYQVEYPYVKEPREPKEPVILAPDRNMSYKYLIIPDVALAKGRIARRYFAEMGAYIESDNGYAFSDTAPAESSGKVYEIESAERYVPKKLQKMLADKKVKKVSIMKHDFPYSPEKITKELGIKEGGTHLVAFTTVGGKKWALFLKKPSV